MLCSEFLSVKDKQARKTKHFCSPDTSGIQGIRHHMLFCLKEVNCLIEMVEHSCDGNTKGWCWMYFPFPLLPAIARNSKNGPFSPICNLSDSIRTHGLFSMRSYLGLFCNPLRKAEPDLWPCQGCHEANPIVESRNKQGFLSLVAQLIFFYLKVNKYFPVTGKVWTLKAWALRFLFSVAFLSACVPLF